MNGLQMIVFLCRLSRQWCVNIDVRVYKVKSLKNRKRRHKYTWKLLSFPFSTSELKISSLALLLLFYKEITMIITIDSFEVCFPFWALNKKAPKRCNLSAQEISNVFTACYADDDFFPRIDHITKHDVNSDKRNVTGLLLHM